MLRARVLIVYPYMARYREGIFMQLANSDVDGVEYRFCSDSETNEKSIELIDLETASQWMRWRRVKNVWFGRHILWQRGVLSAVSDNSITAVIFMGNMYYLSTWVAGIFARVSGKRVLFWTHGFRRQERGFKAWVRLLFYRIAHGLIVYGDKARRILASSGYPAKRVYVAHNSLDYEKQLATRSKLTCSILRETRARYFDAPERPLLVYVGRVNASKRLDMLVDAVSLLNERRLDVNVLVIGAGPALNALRELTKKRALEKQVKLLGACYDEETLGPILAAAHLCVVPGALGLTGIHALTYGTPVLTHDDMDEHGPEFEAIIDGKTGSFFRKGNAQSLTDEISRWVDLSTNRELIRRECYRVIEAGYTPVFQRRVFDAAAMDRPI